MRNLRCAPSSMKRPRIMIAVVLRRTPLLAVRIYTVIYPSGSPSQPASPQLPRKRLLTAHTKTSIRGAPHRPKCQIAAGSRRMVPVTTAPVSPKDLRFFRSESVKASFRSASQPPCPSRMPPLPHIYAERCMTCGQRPLACKQRDRPILREPRARYWFAAIETTSEKIAAILSPPKRKCTRSHRPPTLFQSFQVPRARFALSSASPAAP